VVGGVGRVVAVGGFCAVLDGGYGFLGLGAAALFCIELVEARHDQRRDLVLSRVLVCAITCQI
jgi:hypothetical protein